MARRVATAPLPARHLRSHRQQRFAGFGFLNGMTCHAHHLRGVVSKISSPHRAPCSCRRLHHHEPPPYTGATFHTCSLGGHNVCIPWRLWQQRPWQKALQALRPARQPLTRSMRAPSCCSTRGSLMHCSRWLMQRQRQLVATSLVTGTSSRGTATMRQPCVLACGGCLCTCIPQWTLRCLPHCPTSPLSATSAPGATTL